MALILTRRVSTEQRPESIFIGDEIEITILGVKGNQVRIAISAPDHVNIVRSELLERDKAKEQE